MAQVYRAIQPTIERPVAIKVLHGHLAASPEFVDRFKREARGLGQLQHPHIVQVIDFDVQGELYYMVMDYVPGKTLRAYLDERGPISAAETLALAEQLASALAYAHRRGIIHRDVKPSNVLFRDEACSEAVLTDFGIGKLVADATMTMSGSVIGTPAYMSPEAGLGQPVDARADLYSLGIMMYEMVTGHVPYSGDTPISVIMKQIHEPLPPLRAHPVEIPAAVVHIIERALAKDVASRYQSAEDLAAEIRAARAALTGPRLTPQVTLALSEYPSMVEAAPAPVPVSGAAPVRPAPQTTAGAAAAASARPNRWLFAAAAVVIVLLVGAGLFLRGRPGGQAATAEATIDRAKKVLASDTLAEAERFLEETRMLLGQVRGGRDSDGNGVVDLLLAEGGITGIAVKLSETSP